MDSYSILKKLQADLNTIVERNWDPTFCLRKMIAVSQNHMNEYCSILEEELALKTQRLEEAHRSGDLSTQIVDSLRHRIALDREEIERLREENQKLISDFRHLKVSYSAMACDIGTIYKDIEGIKAQRVEDRSLDRLIENLEAENRRMGAENTRLEKELAESQKRIARMERTIEELRTDVNYATRQMWYPGPEGR
jgi:chromosome segregation ATPase